MCYELMEVRDLNAGQAGSGLSACGVLSCLFGTVHNIIILFHKVVGSSDQVYR